MRRTNRGRAFPGNAIQGALAAVALLLVCGMPTRAFASGTRFSLVGVGDWDKPSTDTGDSYSMKAGFGGGALLDFSLDRPFWLEIGGLYITRKIDDTTGSAPTTMTTHAIQVPVLLRWQLNRMFSLAAGGYAAFGVGNIDFSADNGTVSLPSVSYSQEGVKSTDYGILASAQARLPISIGTALILDGRYNVGLSNVNNGTTFPGTSFKYRDIQAIVGLQFGMGGGGGRYYSSY